MSRRGSSVPSLGNLARLNECKRLLAAGCSSQEVASRLKRHPYYVQKLVRAGAKLHRATSCGDASVRLAELDHALKGGSRLPAISSWSGRSSTSRAAAPSRRA